MSEAFTTLGWVTRVSQTAASRAATGVASPAWPPISAPMPVGTRRTQLKVSVILDRPAGEAEEGRRRRTLPPGKQAHLAVKTLLGSGCHGKPDGRIPGFQPRNQSSLQVNQGTGTFGAAGNYQLSLKQDWRHRCSTVIRSPGIRIPSRVPAGRNPSRRRCWAGLCR